MQKIQKNMEVFYRQAADSLSDRSLVPYMEFGMNVSNTFVQNTIKYKETIREHDMLFVCDTIICKAPHKIEVYDA